MELLLNLAWLLLAIPAYWLWRGCRISRKISALQCLLALACLLVMLFPVVSATDDLRVMRAEMEESPLNKRTIRSAGQDRDKSSPWAGWQTPAAISASNRVVVTNDDAWQQLPDIQLSRSSVPSIARAGRGPPVSLLG
jgi:hypothetical protein